MSNPEQKGKMPMGDPQQMRKGMANSNLKTGDSGGNEMTMPQRDVPLTGKMGTRMKK